MSFDFFSRFIPIHTVDFTSTRETQARRAITASFLTRYPVDDVGFEFIVFPGKLGAGDVQLQVDNFSAVKGVIEQEHGARVHASMHFPTTANMALCLGNEDPGVIGRVVSLFDRCLDLAMQAGISVIVVHGGANVDNAGWKELARDPSKKDRVLVRIASRLVEMLRAMHDAGYRGKIALENMPWPFDIPEFTFTNMIAPDFSRVLALVDNEAGRLAGGLGLCFDACHAYILAETAKFFKNQAIQTTPTLPPGFFQGEIGALIDSSDPGCLVDMFTTRIVHVHAADSAGSFSYHDGLVESRLSEGDVLGTGMFTRSGEFDRLLGRVASFVAPGTKLGCTLEIKHDDLSKPEKTAKSLAWLGKEYFNNRA